MNNRLFIIYITLITSTLSVFSQSYENDAALWLSAGLEKPINEKFSLYLDHKCRINNNVSNYSLSYVKGGVSYSVFNWLKIEGDYGYGKQLQKEFYYLTKHRFNFSAFFKIGIDKFDIVYRNRTQARLTDKEIGNKDLVQNCHNRSRLAIKYELSKRVKPYASYEIYCPLYHFSKIIFDRSRTEIGVNYKLTRNSSVEIFYMFQQDLYWKDKPKRDFILGLGYSFELN
ncbi:MAG: DUF2490 domain-containing protein [Bacteroidia bacterium]